MKAAGKLSSNCNQNLHNIYYKSLNVTFHQKFTANNILMKKRKTTDPYSVQNKAFTPTRPKNQSLQQLPCYSHDFEKELQQVLLLRDLPAETKFLF